ncbi:hypothetical protein ILYODFUR_013995 [Ilyodon furcidens]|uniref:Uncharacterized protein n=1 Tax=Ilyodon furcidens TaxID=33524 RepID=A0ABV0SLE8_9TELE
MKLGTPAPSKQQQPFSTVLPPSLCVLLVLCRVVLCFQKHFHFYIFILLCSKSSGLGSSKLNTFSPQVSKDISRACLIDDNIFKFTPILSIHMVFNFLTFASL